MAMQRTANINKGKVEGSLYKSLYGDMKEKVLQVFWTSIEEGESTDIIYDNICDVLFTETDADIDISEKCRFLYSIYEVCYANRIVYKYVFMNYGKDNSTDLFKAAESKIECGPGIPPSWEELFLRESFRLAIATISRNMINKYDDIHLPSSIYDIFRCFHATNFNNLKVVLVGQDPYHQTMNIGGKTVSKAVGLSFSIREEDSRIPASLKNIYKRMSQTVTRETEVENEDGTESTIIEKWTPPNHGNLFSYAEQGILLLNTYLTVCPVKKAKSHRKLWGNFVRDNIIKYIDENCESVIFLLWGREAQAMKNVIGDRHFVLETSHPSGFSYRLGFNECDHFNEINNILESNDKTPIDWFSVH